MRVFRAFIDTFQTRPLEAYIRREHAKINRNGKNKPVQFSRRSYGNYMNISVLHTQRLKCWKSDYFRVLRNAVRIKCVLVEVRDPKWKTHNIPSAFRRAQTSGEIALLWHNDIYRNDDNMYVIMAVRVRFVLRQTVKQNFYFFFFHPFWNTARFPMQ